MKRILLIPFILMGYTMCAQNLIDATAIVVDNKDEIHTDIEHVFFPLDKREITSGILLDKYLYRLDSLPFSGNTQANTVMNADKLHKLYAVLYNSLVVNPFGMTNPEQVWHKHLYEDRATIPMSLLFMQYHKIKEDAFDNNLIEAKDGQLYDVQGRNESPYNTHKIFAAAPLKLSARNLDLRFIIDATALVTNVVDEQIIQVEIDFGDGLGFTSVLLPSEWNIRYGDFGSKAIITKITTAAGKVYFSRSELVLKDYGAPVAKGVLSSEKAFDCAERYTWLIDATKTAKVSVDCACNATGITKPLVIVEGFDVGDVRNYPQFLTNDDKLFPQRWEEWVHDRRNEGFDVVYVDWGDEYRRSIKGNAELLLDVFSWLNIEKAFNDSEYGNLLIGASMGGLISRYALLLNEQRIPDPNNSLHHDVNLFVSFDAPQMGSNIPLSLQMMVYMLNQLNPEEEALIQAKNDLYATSSKELNTYHVEQYESLLKLRRNADEINRTNPPLNGVHYEFMKSMEDMGGFPKFSRNVAVINGSGNGVIQDPAFAEGSKILNWDYGQYELALWTSIDITANCHMLNSSSDYARLFDMKRSIFAIPILTEIVHSVKINVSNALPLDNSPGGGTDVHKVLEKELDKDPGLLKHSEANTFGLLRHSFVPSISSAAIDFPGNDFDAWWYNRDYYANISDPEILKYSKFDKVYFQDENEMHVFRNDDLIREFLSVETGIRDLYVQNKELYETRTYLAQDVVEIGANVAPSNYGWQPGPVLVKTGGNVNYKAGKKIHVGPGFSSEFGAKFHLKVTGVSPDPICDFPPEPRRAPAGYRPDVENNPEINEAITRSLVYPNPTNSGSVSLDLTQFEEVNSIVIVNLLGQELFRKDNVKAEVIGLDVSNFEKGTYLVYVADDNTKYSDMLIVY